jgi:hypothetical protein
VEDLAGLLLGRRVGARALGASERLEDAAREIRAQHQRHPGREQRIPTEDRHVPGRPGGDGRDAGLLGVGDLQGPEVPDGLLQGFEQLRGIGVDARQDEIGTRADRRRLGLVVGAAAEPRLQRHRAQGHGHVEADRGLATGFEVHLPGQATGDGQVGGTVGPHRGGAPSCAVPEPQRALDHVPVVDLRCHRARLHLEDRREVGIGGQLHRDRPGVEAVVAQHDHLAHALPDAAPAEDHQIGVGLPGERRASAHEPRLVRHRHARPERLEACAIDAQLPVREDPDVEDEEPLGEVREDVPVGRGDAEGLSVDRGHRTRRHGQRRHRARVDPR